MANLYLREDLAGASVGGEVVLEGAEAKHLVAVSRSRVGDAVAVSNGRGLLVAGVLETAEPSMAVIRVETVSDRPAPERRLVLVQALAKGDRDELAVQVAEQRIKRSITPDDQVRLVQRYATQLREAR